MFPAFHGVSCSFKFLQCSHIAFAISGGDDGDALVEGLPRGGFLSIVGWGCRVLPPVASPRCLLEVGRKGPARPPGARVSVGGLRRGDQGRINPEGS